MVKRKRFQNPPDLAECDLDQEEHTNQDLSLPQVLPYAAILQSILFNVLLEKTLSAAGSCKSLLRPCSGVSDIPTSIRLVQAFSILR